MTSPQAADLAYRLGEALGGHDPEADVYDKIVNGYRAAGGESATWDDLPADIQALVVQVEQLPATAWDDPADVPGDLDDSYLD